MPNINKANRQVCDLDIRVLKTMAPYLFFEDANVTTFGFSSEDTYAKARGANKIAFSNPMDGTMSVEAQVKPFKLYAMLSNGEVETTSVEAKKETIKCTTAGKLTLPTGVKAGTVFVYKVGEWGGTAITGTVATAEFSSTTPADLVVDTEYEVGYIITKTEGVNKVSFNNKKNPTDYYIEMLTTEKDEEGIETAYKIIGYKCKPKKSLDLSFSSEGDAATVKIEFSCLEDKDGNFADMIEYTA